ncbi:MAG: SpoIVB peptidase [Vallitaleaceae bacterium]|nr:SpoIVB peptidase [Vallitaleaceae bacterium]
MNRKIYRSILLFSALFVTLIICLHFAIEMVVPSNMKMVVGEPKAFGYNMPLRAEVTGPIKGVLKVNSKPVPNDKIQINLQNPFSISSSTTGKFNVEVKFLGFITVKNLQVEVINPQSYIPVGKMVGVTVSTDGILVLGTGNFIDENGGKKSPSDGKLLTGDYILKVNGIVLDSKEALIDEISRNSGQEMSLEIRRNDVLQTVVVKPQKASIDDSYKLGIWVRDDTQGIGTLTYINVQDMSFGALGHGITDIDTKQLMELSGGTIVTSLVTSIIKGDDGAPGEISGVIVDSEENTVAHVKKNCGNGIFGELTEKGLDTYSNQDGMEIGFKYDVHVGAATILSDVGGELAEYDIQIERIYLNDKTNKGMIIKVVDPVLLKLTNGIIQGMSGSPIIQEGKLIGAVTHVFVQDSSKGYGTFIENMLLEE